MADLALELRRVLLYHSFGVRGRCHPSVCMLDCGIVGRDETASESVKAARLESRVERAVGGNRKSAVAGKRIAKRLIL